MSDKSQTEHGKDLEKLYPHNRTFTAVGVQYSEERPTEMRTVVKQEIKSALITQAQSFTFKNNLKRKLHTILAGFRTLLRGENPFYRSVTEASCSSCSCQQKIHFARQIEGSEYVFCGMCSIERGYFFCGSTANKDIGMAVVATIIKLQQNDQFVTETFPETF